MQRKHRNQWGANGFWSTGPAVSSFRGVSVSSDMAVRDLRVTNAVSLADLTISSLTGGAGFRGIATINSGTTVASVTATAARSGAVIQTTIYMYASILSSQAPITTGVESVRAGAFEIRTVGSNAPVGNMPVSWLIVR